MYWNVHWIDIKTNTFTTIRKKCCLDHRMFVTLLPFKKFLALFYLTILFLSRLYKMSSYELSVDSVPYTRFCSPSCPLSRLGSVISHPVTYISCLTAMSTLLMPSNYLFQAAIALQLQIHEDISKGKHNFSHIPLFVCIWVLYWNLCPYIFICVFGQK